ncbi:hypothetical protein [Neorhodopirellula pilleata]|uniref:Uncharacterized protein n=1 Tax=Neorhodopirellula pilleata TaxID=2714738 RepID=A0A5C5ZWQ9_9BACT|nr:hypothetical protein [Neorhodopirellula pilleata]TWT91409.1 hypothetical protein Pla100_52590 [Neorhodopirellula pilleata]TWT91458.1 hypothetical protein Pla100_53080 [Neorhodopirellula pilleata]
MLDAIVRSRFLRLYLVTLTIVCVVGCEIAPPRIAITPKPVDEMPSSVNLPVSLRQTNWLYGGEGSCAVASLVSVLRWQNNHAAAERLRKHYGGGQTATSIQNICKSERLPYVAIDRPGDARFLQWCSDHRLGAIIWYLPAHCCTFCGFAKSGNGDTYAIVLDNNRVQTPIRVPANEFIRAWQGYGGFALTVLGTPLPAPFYDRWNPCTRPDSCPDFSPLPPLRFCSSVAAPDACSLATSHAIEPTTISPTRPTKPIATASASATAITARSIATVPTVPTAPAGIALIADLSKTMTRTPKAALNRPATSNLIRRLTLASRVLAARLFLESTDSTRRKPVRIHA